MDCEARKTRCRYWRHLYRCRARSRGTALQRQDTDDPGGARACGPRGDAYGVARGGTRPGRFGDHHTRHDLGDQCDHRAQGCQDRFADDRGISRHDRDPAREPLRAIRRQYRPAAAAGAAPAALSGARAHRRPRPSAGAARRGGDSATGRPPGRRAHREHRDRVSAQLHKPGARATRRRDSCHAAARGGDYLVEQRLARNARIRALLDGLRQRLCPAVDRPLSRRSRSDAAPRGLRLPAVSDAVGWRADRGRNGNPLSGAARRIGSGGGCHVRCRDRPAMQARQGAVLRHGRDDRENLSDRRAETADQPRLRGRAHLPLQKKAAGCRCGFRSSRWSRSAPEAARSRGSIG